MSAGLRAIDWIWHVRGTLPIEPGQTSYETLGRLSPVFATSGTTCEKTATVLTFRKRDSASQDPLAAFDGGTLRIVADDHTSRLHYDLTSRALLCCFLAPPAFAVIAREVDGAHISGYVFAGIFAVLYIGGRVIEARNLRALFRRHLAGAPAPMAQAAVEPHAVSAG